MLNYKRAEMISLVPSWARNYDAFWDAIRKRNLWFIKLRYGAVIVLFLFLILAKFVLGIQFSNEQIFALISINLFIFIYNIFFHIYRRKIKIIPGKFNPLHFSLLQMNLDICALYLLVYYTGTIESPLYMLLIFHMIIGSLVLPGVVIYSIAAMVIVGFSVLVFLEYSHSVIHYSLGGLLAYPIYSDLNYCIAFTVIFAFSIIISVLLTNRVAQQLYIMEQDLVESIEKINAAESDKQRYIINVIHEIKTPLTAVQSFLDVVLEKMAGPLSEKVEEKLKRAKIRSLEAFELINNILKISKLRLFNELNRENIQVESIIQDILNKLNDTLKGKRITVIVNDEREFKRSISADKFLIEIVISNIIGNAVKYVGENGKIIVTLTETENDIEIDICDNGIGVPESEYEKIFDDFYRASNIKSLGFEGAGLGLPAVKHIVEKHSGNIFVESPSNIGTKENPGTCFRITIPIRSQ
ncbi:MAG: HAMP domain-containing sensor histidine kinase [Ignavibacteriaceae bacterium]